MMYKIVFTGGGTAGHVVPNIAIMQKTNKYFDKTYYIGSDSGIEKSLIKPLDIPFYSVPCVKFSRDNFLKNLKIPFSLMSGVSAAKKILKKIKPDVVFSKGGYVAVPVVLAAKSLGIPVVCHESDYSLGLANKLTAKFAKAVLTSFPSAAKGLKNGIFIGPPIKEFNLKNKRLAKQKFGFSGDKPLLLAFGGSQGASAITAAVKKAAPLLENDFDILLIAGKSVKEARKTGSVYETPFISDMETAYSAADVALARCGSNSAFEILSLKIPVVFVPLKKGNSRGDQVMNAEYFLKSGNCLVLNESDLTEKSLAAYVNSAYRGLKLNQGRNDTKVFYRKTHDTIDKTEKIEKPTANSPENFIDTSYINLKITDSSGEIAEILYNYAKNHNIKKCVKK